MKLPVIVPYFSFDQKDTHRKFLLQLLTEAQKYDVEFIVVEGVHATLSKPLPDLSSRCAEHFVFNASSCLWLKENLINLAVKASNLTEDVFAFIDSDVLFCDADWAKKSIDLIASCDVLQPFSYRHDTDSSFVIQKWLDSRVEFESFAHGISRTRENSGLVRGHPGFAWVMRRSLFNKMGGLFDKLIVGGGDSFLATLVVSNLVDDFRTAFQHRFHKRYSHIFLPYAEALIPFFNGVVCGCLPGSIVHMHHGDIRHRFYNRRFDILLREKFNVSSDLAYNDSGVLCYAKPDTRLEAEIRSYIVGRSGT
jgi:hypothetical protein